MINADRPNLIITGGFPDYELLDSGDGRKLERLGRFLVDRPEAQAIWQRKCPDMWTAADAIFADAQDDDDTERGRWKQIRSIPEKWPLHLRMAGHEPLTVLARLTSFRHMGLFPEQLPHWQWMMTELAAISTVGLGRPPRVLNLFAYTGVASLVACLAGAEVTHVDASKPAVTWAKQNQEASSMKDAALRWIVDDARKFVAREVRRGRQYDMILIDPPKFGRGPDGEIWNLFTDLPPLMRDCVAILAPSRTAIILTVYAIRASTLTFRQLAGECLAGRTGEFDYGELAIAPIGGGQSVPTSLYTRWSSA